jgi:hypothetical protein
MATAGRPNEQLGHGLEALTFEVTVMNCGGDPLQISGKQTPQSTGDCLTVGQQRVPLRGDTSNTYQKGVVPPGQTRSFTSYAVHFDGMPPTVRPGANRSFTWKLVEVRAAY